MENRSLKLFLAVMILMSAVLAAGVPADFLLELQTKFDRYREKFPATKISIIFNQPTYAPGDTMFFKAWYLDEELHPIKGNHIISMNLLTGEGKIAQRINFKIQNGTAGNQMILDKELKPGGYRILAYTNWMRNFGEAYYFQKDLKIEGKYQVKVTTTKPKVQFFPEGGSLVAGVSNNVLITGPSSTEWILRDQSQAEVQKVQIDSFGIGHFTFRPSRDFDYFVRDSDGKRYSLPAAGTDGVSLVMNPESVGFAVGTQSPWIGQELFAVITSGNKIRYTKRVIFEEGKAQLDLPPTTLNMPLSQLFLFNSQGAVVAQRTFYRPSKTEDVMAMSCTQQVSQRGGITLNIQTNLTPADLCVTAFLDGLFKNDILLNPFYFADLPEVTQWASQFSELPESAINEFLISQKWKRINWEDVLNGSEKEKPFPFRSLLSLKGKVISKTTGEPAPDSTIIMTYMQDNAMGYDAYTRDGLFEVPFIFDFWGEDRLFCSLEYKSKNVDDAYQIVVYSDSLPYRSRWTSAESLDPSTYGTYAFNRNIVTNSYSFFGNQDQSKLKKEQNLNAIFEDELAGTDFDVKVTDYVVFPTMEDLLREVVPFVQYRKKGAAKGVRMLFRYETTTQLSADNPLYVVDGVMTKDTDYFMSLKPENLLTIKIVNNPNKLPQLGKIGENGIILIESKKGNMADSLLQHNHFPIVGLSRGLEPVAVVQSRVPDRFPDIRPTLYWNPSLSVDEQGKAEVTFLASDDIGPVSIVVRGLTQTGIPLTIRRKSAVTFAGTIK